MPKTLKQILSYSLLIITLTLSLGTPLISFAACPDNGYCIITTLPGSKEVVAGTSVKGGALTLAKYIEQIYIFSLGIVGLIAVAAIVFWSFTYIISAGNPSKMSDAMGGIKDAVLGLIILLLATLILNFINPNLTKLNPFDSLAGKLNEDAKGPALFSTPTWVQKTNRGSGGYTSCGQVGKVDAIGCDPGTEPAPIGNNLCCMDEGAPNNNFVGPPAP